MCCGSFAEFDFRGKHDCNAEGTRRLTDPAFTGIVYGHQSEIGTQDLRSLLREATDVAITINQNGIERIGG